MSCAVIPDQMMSKVFAYILEPVSATNKSIMPKRDAANELNHDNWEVFHTFCWPRKRERVKDAKKNERERR